jgi:hypothetical protein
MVRYCSDCLAPIPCEHSEESHSRYLTYESWQDMLEHYLNSLGEGWLEESERSRWSAMIYRNADKAAKQGRDTWLNIVWIVWLLYLVNTLRRIILFGLRRKVGIISSPWLTYLTNTLDIKETWRSYFVIQIRLLKREEIRKKLQKKRKKTRWAQRPKLNTRERK